MTARLRADIFVAAYLRRCNGDGAPAMLRRRGAAEAGAILVKVDRLDGTCVLYGPAPQSLADEDGTRRFVRLHEPAAIDVADAETKLSREVAFDSDIWIIEVEDRSGRSRLDEVDPSGA